MRKAWSSPGQREAPHLSTRDSSLRGFSLGGLAIVVLPSEQVTASSLGPGLDVHAGPQTQSCFGQPKNRGLTDCAEIAPKGPAPSLLRLTDGHRFRGRGVTSGRPEARRKAQEEEEEKERQRLEASEEADRIGASIAAAASAPTAGSDLALQVGADLISETCFWGVWGRGPTRCGSRARRPWLPRESDRPGRLPACPRGCRPSCPRDRRAEGDRGRWTEDQNTTPSFDPPFEVGARDRCRPRTPMQVYLGVKVGKPRQGDRGCGTKKEERRGLGGGRDDGGRPGQGRDDGHAQECRGKGQGGHAASFPR